MPRVDEQNFSSGPELKISKGSGDSETTFRMQTLRSGDSGKNYWLLDDSGKKWLYLFPTQPPAKGESTTVRQVHETFAADRVEPGRFLGHDISRMFRWAQLGEPMPGQPKPFHDATEALLLGEGSYVKVLPAVPVLEYRGDLYTPDFKAEKMPWRLLGEPRPSSMAGLGPVVLLAGLMSALFGLVALSTSAVPIHVFWWLAPMFGVLGYGAWRSTDAGKLARLVAGVFFLHFLTRGVDVAITGDWEEVDAGVFEAWKLCGTFLLMALLVRVRPQLYFGLVDGAYRVAPALWTIGVVTLLFMLDEGNYFPWFNYYSGVMPWGLLLGSIGLVSVAEKIWDYRKAPVDTRGFVRLLYRTTETLEKGPETAMARSARLAQWGDDLEDALSISASPEVVALADLGPDFLLWKTQAKALASYDEFSPDRQNQVREDLAVIAGDFRAIAESLEGRSGKKRSSIRHSPYLATYNQE